jgi:chromosome segregation ATPase
MNRALIYVNLVGVLLLAALSVAQWQANRRANLETIAPEKVRQGQSAKLIEQDKVNQGQAADLESFRGQLARTHATLKEVEGRLGAAERDLLQRSAERDQLEVSVTNWAAAVTARDQQLKSLNEDLQKLAKDRNEVVGKFNDLASKYNTVVKDLNEARTRLFGTNATAAPTPGK